MNRWRLRGLRDHCASSGKLRHTGRSSYTRCCTLLFVLLLTLANSLIAADYPSARNGVVDLSTWSFEEQGAIDLSGEWLFYWQSLLSPDDIQHQKPAGEIQKVPAPWTSYPQNYPAEGYATFQLRVKLSDQPISLGMLIPRQGMAYKLWLNGKLVSENGTVSVVPRTARAAQIDNSAYFDTGGSDLDIVMQISNYHHRKAGFRNTLVLGTSADIHRIEKVRWMKDTYLGGMILTLALTALFLFIFRPQDKSYLFLGLLSVGAGLRVALVNQAILPWLVPYLSWEWSLRIEYLTFYYGIVFCVALLNTLYPQEISRRFVLIVTAVSTLFALPSMFLDTLKASYLIPPYQIIYCFFLIATLYFTAKVVRHRRSYSTYAFFAYAVVAFSQVIETLYRLDYLPYGEVAIPGFAVAMIVLLVMLSDRSSRTLDQEAKLTEALEKRNVQLLESEQKYRTIFENTRDVIFITDIENRIELVNPAIEELLGITPEKARAIGGVDLFAQSEDLQRFVTILEEKGVVEEFPTEIRHADGHLVPVLVSAWPRLDSEGSAAGFQGYVRNLSDQVQAQQQQERADKLELIAALDPLTRTYNRRYFQDVAEREIARSLRSGCGLALIMMDIDHFKKVNDRYGHLVGDDILAAVAGLLRENIRESDIFARFGGEEFVILMPDSGVDQAGERAEGLRRFVARETFHAREEKALNITVSMGVTAFQKNDTLDSLLERADRALYRAKSDGRNRVFVFPTE